jgi:ankyrin repeat protein
MWACSNGHTNVVELLLAAPGVDVNAANVSRVSGETPARCGQSPSRSLAASRRCGRTAGCWAGRFWRWIALTAGCDLCCCVQEDGSTALMVVCKRGHTDIMTLLLAVPGLDVNVADVSCVSGKRPHAMISHRHVRLLRA